PLPPATPTPPLPLHDALPIYPHPPVLVPLPPVAHRVGAQIDVVHEQVPDLGQPRPGGAVQPDDRLVSHRQELPAPARRQQRGGRSEEHTSELQSRENLVCRLL